MRAVEDPVATSSTMCCCNIVHHVTAVRTMPATIESPTRPCERQREWRALSGRALIACVFACVWVLAVLFVSVFVSECERPAAQIRAFPPLHRRSAGEPQPRGALGCTRLLVGLIVSRVRRLLRLQRQGSGGAPLTVGTINISMRDIGLFDLKLQRSALAEKNEDGIAKFPRPPSFPVLSWQAGQ